MEYLVYLLASFFAVVIVLTLHEFAHAFAAYKCGDPTAKFAGRMSLNPLQHFDPLGLVAFAVAGFGWAKPVPVNPSNFRHYKSGSFWTSAAGVLTNYVCAFLFYPLFILTAKYLLIYVQGKYMEIFLGNFVALLYLYSLNFCVFNLFPLYPLDGFRIMDTFAKKRGKVYWFLRQYGYYILLGLILINYLAGRFPVLQYINVFGYAMKWLVKIFGMPITAFWNLIFS